MIKPVVGLHFPFVAYKNAGRLLLRPHGMSEGNVRRVKVRDGQLWQHYIDKWPRYSYDTRAQAARAVWEEYIEEMLCNLN